MATQVDYEAERRAALHLWRSGHPPKEIAAELGRSLAWVYKWHERFESEGWKGLKSQSRAPKRCAKQLPEAVRQAIRQARSELEAEASEPDKLSYVGAPAILARLRHAHVTPLPSLSSIERVLHAAGMVRPRRPQQADVHYPHLVPKQAHTLVQVDIVPKVLTGGQTIACFNALDVVSRYPTGKQYAIKRATDAVDFLLHVWSTLGIPTYTQLDNEGCFSGGFTHQYVLGQVLRCGLLVGTELVYSPFYHPQSNGFVERFHQDYEGNVWDKTQLPDLAAVQRHSSAFFEKLRDSEHHSTLNGQSPAQLHLARPFPKLPVGFTLPKRLPLTAGRVHFMRLVNEAKQISLLNVTWDVAKAVPNQGVWATLELTERGAKLMVFDKAPDAPYRTCLATHSFPLKEDVVPLQPQFRRQAVASRPTWWRSATRPIAQLFSTMF